MVLFVDLMCQAIRYASQHIWCLSQARINWEGCARKSSLRKNGGMAEVGAPISLDGWQSMQIVGASACVIFILLQKIQKMAKCTFWYRLTRVVPDNVQIAVKWLCVVMCLLFYTYAVSDHIHSLPNLCVCYSSLMVNVVQKGALI